jgi:hypothetical protein
MHIKQEGNRIRLELAEQNTDNKKWTHLFNFSIDKSAYSELREHMIKALNEFEPK